MMQTSNVSPPYTIVVKWKPCAVATEGAPIEAVNRFPPLDSEGTHRTKCEFKTVEGNSPDKWRASSIDTQGNRNTRSHTHQRKYPGETVTRESDPKGNDGDAAQRAPCCTCWVKCTPHEEPLSAPS